jgi:hypothetical protein
MMRRSTRNSAEVEAVTSRLPEDWFEPEEELFRQNLEAELRREVGEGHVLRGLGVRLLAQYGPSDDALFGLDDGRVAQVHLTWSGSPEPIPQVPITSIFKNIEEWLSFWNSP